MDIVDKVHNTPLVQRPKVLYNGVVQDMDDDQYAAYLRMQAELEQMPPSDTAAELATLKKDYAALVDAVMRGV